MKNLEIKWSVSRAAETREWNICTLVDGKKRYKTCGGGYDMHGTVFGQWLKANYLAIIREKVKPYKDGEGAYGLYESGGKLYLDGACGLSSMIAIAKAIGLKVTEVWTDGLTNIMVEEI